MLATRQSEQAFGARTKLVGIIKEVAPTKDAEDDETLGVNDFHENYFLGLPLFMDSKMSFHNSLGRRKVGDVGFSTWNPFSIMGRLWRAIMAIRAMGIDGNLKGEGNILGGVIVVQPSKGIIYSFQEKMGEPFPYVPCVNFKVGAISLYNCSYIQYLMVLVKRVMQFYHTLEYHDHHT